MVPEHQSKRVQTGLVSIHMVGLLSLLSGFSMTHLSLPQSFSSAAAKAPFQVILLRALAFLACAFLLSTTLYGPSEPFTPGAALPPALPPGNNSSASDNTTSQAEGWQQLLGLLPEHATEKLHEAWAFGQSHQTGIVAVGLLTCLLAMLLAGRIRCVLGPWDWVAKDLHKALLPPWWSPTLG